MGSRATFAVAWLTFFNTLKQPLTWLVAALGVILVGASYIFGMFSFEADGRLGLLVTAGVAVSILHGAFLGIYCAASSVHNELASRTALTLFAKPMDRSSFLIGKIIGVIGAVSVMVIPIILAHMAVLLLAVTQGFDLQDFNHWIPEDGFLSWGRVLLGHFLAIVSSLVLICFAAVMALRAPVAMTLVTTFGIFVLAHLIGGMGYPAGIVLPTLTLFHIDEALGFQDMPVTPLYFTLSLAHAGLYSAACILVGMALFSHQDIP